MGFKDQLYIAFHLFGVRKMLQIVRYTLFLQRANYESRRRGPKAGAVSTQEQQVEAHTMPQVRFFAPGCAFISWDGSGMRPSYALADDAPAEPAPALLCPTADGAQVFTDGEIEIRLLADGCLEFYAAGHFLRRERPPQPQPAGWSQTADLAPEACIYGLGERAAGRLNLRPGTYSLWNRDHGPYGPGVDPIYITMPVYLGLQDAGCYLVFYDNTWRGRVELGEQAQVSFDGGPMRMYFISGSPQVVLERFTSLVGRAPLPPHWALGYQHSRWGFDTEKEVRRVFDGFRQRGLPLSALYLDIDHMVDYRTLTVDERRFPALGRFAAEMETYGTRLVPIVDPGVKKDPAFDLYQEGLAEDAFVKMPSGEPVVGVVWPGDSLFPDFTDPKARAWWGRQYARLLPYGFAGAWHDMNEPSSFTANGELNLPEDARHNFDGQGAGHLQAHNVYGMLMDRAGCEGLRSLHPHKRPYIVSRSGWVGMQRYTWSWTADTLSTWEALRMTPATVLGLSLSGEPYSGPDVGGFSGHSPAELYIRWFQLGALLPFFRTHSAFYLPRREPWEFGALPGEGDVLVILRAVLSLRYRLLPYLYTLAWQCSRNGAPLVRPLWWADPTDAALRSVDDAFLLGDDLLAAPVLDEGARSRRVRLPRGGWLPLDGQGVVLEGPDEVELPAPLNCVPLLARAGAILPLADRPLEGRPGAEGFEGTLTLHVYRPLPGEEGRGVLYRDAGDGYGPCRVDEFTLGRSTEGEYRLEQRFEGEYPVPEGLLPVVMHGFETGEKGRQR